MFSNVSHVLVIEAKKIFNKLFTFAPARREQARGEAVERGEVSVPR
jgi:hypothetical protein